MSDKIWNSLGVSATVSSSTWGASVAAPVAGVFSPASPTGAAPVQPARAMPPARTPHRAITVTPMPSLFFSIASSLRSPSAKPIREAYACGTAIPVEANLHCDCECAIKNFARLHDRRRETPPPIAEMLPSYCAFMTWPRLDPSGLWHIFPLTVALSMCYTFYISEKGPLWTTP